MLKIEGDHFTLNSKPFRLLSGTIHYFRVPRPYWKDRLLKLKAAGFNTVETYSIWNRHEPRPGEFDFSGDLDIGAFIDTAKEVGLYVIVRPGPYICAEQDFGGLPAWLLKDPGLKLRCMYQPYLDAVTRYYTELFKHLVNRQITHGGNIIAMQVENEYGSYGNDKEYLHWIHQLSLDLGCDVLNFTSDGPYDVNLSGGTIPELYATGNFGGNTHEAYESMQNFRPGTPFTCMEFWCGWFHQIFKEYEPRTPQEVVGELSAILDHGGNFNVYMFHGGTNFGFSGGANYEGFYHPQATTYDDGALLNEWGDYTPKYHAIRKLLLDTQNLEEQPLPPSPVVKALGTVKLTQKGDLLSQKDKVGTTVYSKWPLTMEELDQNYGLVLYRHVLDGPYSVIKAWNQSPVIHLTEVHDRAHLFINGKLRKTFWRDDPDLSVTIEEGLKAGDVIELLVDGMGRINYGHKMLDRKGLTGYLMIGVEILFNWDITSLPLSNCEFSYDGLPEYGPSLLRGTFTVEEPADTFVDISPLKKGIVFVNGHNLGRYWNGTIQETLYLPGCWLNAGENELVVVDYDGADADALTLTDEHRITCYHEKTGTVPR